MSSKDELHRFIDSLLDRLVGEVLDFAQFVSKKAQVEPAAQVMAAMEALPEDDEPLSDDQKAALVEAEASVRAHGTIPLEAIEARYGF